MLSIISTRACGLKYKNRRILLIVLLLVCFVVTINMIYPTATNYLYIKHIARLNLPRQEKFSMEKSAQDRFIMERIIHEKRLRQDVCNDPGTQNGAYDNQAFDYRNYTEKQFLHNFKNPCFLENATEAESNIIFPEMKGKVLRCVPYFVIAGFPKSGSTDLWYQLNNHPDVVAKHQKEPMFFNRYKKGRSFAERADYYVKLYKNTTLTIQNMLSTEAFNGAHPYHPAITGEGSVDTSFDNPNWEKVPGNQNCREPIILNAHYLHRINPNIKVIFVFRNPTERLYSDYIYEARFVKYKTSQQDFHDSVVRGLDQFVNCTRREQSIRACAYKVKEPFKARLRVGLYHIFIEDWMRVIPPENILLVSTDSTAGAKKIYVYRQICQFLNIRPFPEEQERQLFKRTSFNSRSKNEKTMGDMFNETRKLLDTFYKPFNEQLKRFNIL